MISRKYWNLSSKTAFSRRWLDDNTCETGESERWNEFAEWHVTWPAEWHNYAGCNVCRMTQGNKFNLKECARKSIYYIPHNYAISKVIPRAMPETHSTLYPHPSKMNKNKKLHVQSVKNCCFSLLNMQISCRRRRIGWLSSLVTTCGIHVANALAPKGWVF